MKDKRVEWDFFCKRRNVSLPRLLKDAKISSYDDLVVWCGARKIKPPTLGLFNQAQKLNQPPQKQIKPTPSAKKTTSRKRTTRRKTKK
jgi:hypothetical protein